MYTTETSRLWCARSTPVPPTVSHKQTLSPRFFSPSIFKQLITVHGHTNKIDNSPSIWSLSPTMIRTIRWYCGGLDRRPVCDTVLWFFSLKNPKSSGSFLWLLWKQTAAFLREKTTKEKMGWCWGGMCYSGHGGIWALIWSAYKEPRNRFPAWGRCDNPICRTGPPGYT